MTMETKNYSMIDKLNKQFLDATNKHMEEAKYTREDVSLMRINNDNRLYKTPSDVKSLTPHVWENGKFGYFIPFRNTILFNVPMLHEGRKDGKGLRFAQVHKDDKPLIYSQGDDIVISGFGEFVLENWGKDLLKLCDDYIGKKLISSIEQWNKDNYPNKIEKETKLRLLNEIKEIEQKKWSKVTISEYFTSTDYEKLNQCMTVYFEWIDETICKNNHSDATDSLKENIGEPQQYRIVLDKITENKVLEVYQFWDRKDKNRNTNIPTIEVNIFKDITQSDFLEMVRKADFTSLFNTNGFKQRTGQTVVALSNIINDDKWKEQATGKLNTTIRDLQKNTRFHEYETLKNRFM